jgi:hypothetical protein
MRLTKAKGACVRCSGELSWSRCGSKSAASKLSLAGVLAVATIDCPPAGAPLGTNNIFQIGNYTYLHTSLQK